jgi:hypothetical protein
VQVQAQAPFEGSLSASPAGFVVATLLLRDKGKGILKDDCVCSIAYNALSKASPENAPQLHAQSPSSNFAGIYVEKIILRFGLPVVSFDDDFSCLWSILGLGRTLVYGGDSITDGNHLGLGGLMIE